jgi:phosphoglycolate phosphatase
LNELIAAFEEHYDQYGLSNTRPYEGVDELLMKLSPEVRLIIVTNKRHKPTQKIIENLCWTDYFSATYTLDMFTEKGASKSDMIDACLINFSLKKQRCLYVGDREEDAKAASISGVPFIAALWGLNNKDRATMESKYCSRATPVELMDRFLRGEANIVVG